MAARVQPAAPPARNSTTTSRPTSWCIWNANSSGDMSAGANVSPSPSDARGAPTSAVAMEMNGSPVRGLRPVGGGAIFAASANAAGDAALVSATRFGVAGAAAMIKTNTSVLGIPR